MAVEQRSCPECSQSMVAHDVRDLRLDICPDCGGVWFDAGEFGRINSLGSRAVDAVVAEEPPDLKAAAHHVIQHCPVCEEPLNAYHFGGATTIMLSGCSKCTGIYLSRDNLMKLDARDRRVEGRDGEGLGAEVSAAVAYMDSEIAYNTFRTQLAQYNWRQLQNPVMFS